MLTFSLRVHYYWKWLSFLQNMHIFRKMWLFVWRFIYIKELSNSCKKKFNFLGYIKLYVVIFIKVYHLLENWYFDSKYHFVLWYFGQKCHLPSKIYITCGINSLDKLSNFLKKVLIWLSILGKMITGFRSNSVVSSEKKWPFVLEKPLFEGYLQFLANCHHFQNC